MVHSNTGNVIINGGSVIIARGKVGLATAGVGVIEHLAGIFTFQPTTSLFEVIAILVLTVRDHPISFSRDHKIP
jgi:hypothetical protein